MSARRISITGSCASSSRRRERARERGRGSEQGIAIIVAMTAVAILAVMLADMHQSTSSRYTAAMSTRDQLRSEYIADSAIDLTRLLMAREPQLKQSVTPLFQMMMGRPPPQIPVWRIANAVLQPFCDYDNAKASARESGIDLSAAEGLGETGGTCSVIAVAENGKTNINDPLHRDGDEARRSVAMQVFALLGGYHSPSPYDALFETRDADGQLTGRLDVVSDVIDWWDLDQERTSFDPGLNAVTSSGAEDDVYSAFRDHYVVKNAPYDSLEEVRMIRGVGDDFWATFVQPDPEDPQQDHLTIYGSGNVNPNEAPPEVLLARACSFLADQPLCADPAEAAKFVQLVTTVRELAPIPWFTRNEDFLAFLQGQGGANDLYPMLRSMLGPENPLLFRPVTVPPDKRQGLLDTFVTISKIITIQATGTVGNARTRIRSVVNFDERWVPPPPNAGTLPGLGVFAYYRME